VRRIVEGSVLSILLLASTVAAQSPVQPFEISAFAGYFVGGTVFDHDIPGIQNLKIGNDLDWGARFGWNATAHLEPELQWTRTTTTQFATPTHQGLQSLTIDYFLGGTSWNFGSGVTRPYLSLDLGAARIDAIDYLADTLFTISVGAGIKHFFTPHFGVRLDARGYTSLTNERLKSVCITSALGSPGDPVVIRPCAHDWLLNGDFTGGVVIAF
jgi:hypothetical protein